MGDPRMPQRMRAGLLCIAGLLWSLFAHGAGTATNEATDPGGGSVTLLSSGQISVTAENAAVTTVVAEIDPAAVPAASSGINFTYDVLPAINPGNTGIDQIAITAPAGYGGLSVTGVSLGGGAQTASGSCPAPAAGEYCAGVAGQVMTIRLGSKVSVTGTNIKISFNADAPGALGSGNFTSTVDDTGTGSIAAQATTAGNADGDAADANTQGVTVLPQVSFTAASQSGAENAGTLTITAQLSQVSAQNVSLPFTLGGTANNPADYTITASPLIISAGSLSADITVTVVNDALDEDGETVVVTMGTPVNAFAGGTTVHTATITDDDPAPSVSFAAAAASGAESVTPVNITVALSAASSKTVTVDYAVNGASSASGGGIDYTLANGTLTFNPGETSKVISLAVNDDLIAEGNETVMIDLANPSNASLGATPQQVYTVNDNDAAAVTISESGGATNVNETGPSSDSYTLVLATQPAANVTLTVTPDAQVDLGGGAGTAVVLSFTPLNWNLAQSVTVTAVDDASAEGPHNSSITHSANSADAAYNGLVIANVLVNISDNDVPGVTLNESGGVTTASEGGAGDSYTVVLNTAPSANVTVSVTPDAQVDLGAGAGTAVVLSFTPLNWNSAQTVNVTAVDDAIAEGPHSATITHGAASADLNYNALAIPTITVNIADNDTPGVTLSESGGGTSVAETGPGSDSYTVVLNSAPSANVVITVTPDAQVDLGAGAGTAVALSFTPLNWNNAQTVTVTAVDDASAEGPHGAVITHAAASADLNYNALAIPNIVVSISDNDLPGVTFNESGGATTASEGGAGDSYTVVLDSAPGANVVITVTPDAQADLGAGAGTAVALTFTPLNWNNAQTVTVIAIDDAIAEGPHSASITHGAASADLNYNALAIPNITVNVSDNDTAVINFAAASANGDEAFTPVSVNVTLSTASTQIITVNYSIDAAGTASGGGVDYTLASGTLTFNPGDTLKAISLAVNDDALDESDETVVINLSAPVNAILGATPQHSYTLNDNDAAPSAAFAAAGGNALENIPSALITVTLSAASGLPVSVDYGVDPASTATGGGVDYTLASGTLIFNPGETSKDISLAIIDDADTESNETVVVNLSNPLNATLGAIAQHVHSIDNDDNANAVTAAVGEITPASVVVGATGIAFTFDVLPAINPGDSGVDLLSVTAPTGFMGLAITGFSVNGGALAAACPAPAAGQYCASISGATMSVKLGAKLSASGNLQLRFSANAPLVSGASVFSATVDDSATPAAPQAVSAGDADGDPGDGNGLAVSTVFGVDPLASIVTAQPLIVIADGSAASTLSATLIDTSGLRVPGKTVVFDSDRGALDTITQAGAPTGADGSAIAQIRSNTIGVATLRATDISDNIVLLTQPKVYFTQGRVLDITKLANKDEVVIGDVVTYTLIIKNITDKDVLQVKLHDALPPNFKYVPGSTRLNGALAPDPAGHRPLIFGLGTLLARVDSNGNGSADPGEQGYTTLSYQLIVGAGATPREYVNTVYALDVCDVCYISNNAEARVSVTLDPVFDLGTIIGKVFQDPNRNGKQDQGEKGVSGAMVVLDNGSYALTDEHGRYHFPAVKPGPRALKINLQALDAGAEVTTEEITVVNITPGLLAKANFGVIYQHEVEIIGRAANHGLRAQTELGEKPASVFGSVEMLTALVNGYSLALPNGDIKLGLTSVDDLININSGKLEQPLRLSVNIDSKAKVNAWLFTVNNAAHQTVRTLRGEGAPPPVIEWDARDDHGDLLEGGEIYEYQLELDYADDGVARSARRLVGVNRSSAIAVNLTGGAFELGSSQLSPAARQALRESSALLLRFPEEKVVIEGHTDSIGSDEANLRLSQERAEAAARYLMEEEDIPRERLVVRGFGSRRPMASNGLPEGRELNRRVEIKGLVGKVETISVTDQYRAEPGAVINGKTLPLQGGGVFQTQIEPASATEFDIQLTSAQDKSSLARIAVPSLNLPAGEVRVPYGARDDEQGYYADARDVVARAAPEEIVMGFRLHGRTEPGNIVQLDDRRLPVEAAGRFAADIKLKQGVNFFTLLLRNEANFTRVVDLKVKVSARDENGALYLLVQPVPRLAVNFPPKDAALTSPVLVVSGATEPGNKVSVNAKEVALQDDGRFSTTVTLPLGHSSIEVNVSDPAGNSGRISRDIEVRDSKLFLLAFADGKIGQMQAKGYVQGAGMDGASQFYSEGRIAYYLKGVIAGKYLVTSAFDSGTNELGDMFKDLDRAENDRLLTNIDPDKLYPVYGDDSTVVYDSESSGKFYLAVDSDELHAVIGNYPVNFTDTELATYQRTLFGGRLAYQSLARTQYGAPDTQVAVFSAAVRQMHVRDELRATGGSLYYLSHGDIIEGSEQVTLVVRDKDTGLVLSRQPQQQNTDYNIRYVEGRILFTRPLASTQADSRLVDRALLGGNPVSIEVDYETEAAFFEKSASGGRVRQQLNDHVAIGGTYVQDEGAAGQYQLQGLDTEIRLGKGTRLLAEMAQSEGSDGQSFYSDDGGLSFKETTPLDTSSGQAWKLAAEMDIGEWFGQANRYRMGAYMKRLGPGFISNGNSSEISSEKSGLNMSLQVSERDKVLLRQDQEKILSASGDSESSTTTAQLRHAAERWSATAEYQQKETSNAATGINDSSLMAAELRLRVTEKLTASIEQQFTLSGADNDQTGIGVDYSLSSALTLKAKGISGSLGQAAELGAEFNLDGNRLYLTQRLSRDMQNNGRNTTIVGAQSPLGRDGKVYSEYQWEVADQGDRNVSLIGAEQKWRLRRGLQLLLAAELGKIQAASGGSDRYAIATGLSYSHPRGLSASTRNELRRESGVQEREQFLSTNSAELKLDPDYTLLGKYRYSLSRDLDNDVVEAEFEESSLGLAYRPVASDRFNALARYTRQADQRPLSLGAGDMQNISRDIASIEWSLELTPALEWVDKLALRMKEERAGGRPSIATTTFLSINRLNYRIRPRIDLGAEYRLLSQQETDDQRQGWAADVMWRAMEHVRVGGGYNFTDFSDSEFSDNDYSVHGWFLRLQGTY